MFVFLFFVCVCIMLIVVGYGLFLCWVLLMDIKEHQVLLWAYLTDVGNSEHSKLYSKLQYGKWLLNGW